MNFLAQRHTVKIVKNFFGVKDIKEARHMLDRLKAATATAQIPGGVDRVERKPLGGERTRFAWTPPLNHPFLSR
jgi:hypothetical protein